MKAVLTLFALVGLETSLASCSNCSSCFSIQSGLGPHLSQGASILCGTVAPRWSQYDQPAPAATVFVASERDVQATVKYANWNSCQFLAQNGGNGWAADFTLNGSGIIIDIQGLNTVSFDAAKSQATVGGGVNVSTAVSASYVNGVRVVTPTCNCVGYLGALLGGGVSRVMGLYSISADQLVSANMVAWNSTTYTVSMDSHPDLFFALKGAGANFGIVTSATVKTYQAPSNNIAWQGQLIYTADKLGQVVETINNLTLQAPMNVDLYIAAAGSPLTPIVVAVPFYAGTEAQGRAAFAPLLSLSPSNDTTTTFPYNEWNTAAEAFCQQGSRKPAYGASMSTIAASSYEAILQQFAEFVQNPTAENTTILLEAYSTAKALQTPSSSAAFPFRSLKFHGTVIPWYTDPSLDEKANQFASQVRNLWRSTDGLSQNSSYINFAHGDEALQTIYGQSLPKLQQLKREYDPHNKFNQWFPIR